MTRVRLKDVVRIQRQTQVRRGGLLKAERRPVSLHRMASVFAATGRQRGWARQWCSTSKCEAEKDARFRLKLALGAGLDWSVEGFQD